jgi:hypothetical protein
MKKRILVSAVLSVLLLAALAANVHATEAKITASDGATYDLFGVSVAISGDYAVVGAYHDDDAGTSSGSAYIFKRDGTAWTEQAKITASDGAADDEFGASVAISGDYAVVGADGDDDAGTSSGSAYIFKRDGTAWTEQAKITASDGAATDYFGKSVAISGDYAIAGAHQGDGVVSNSGSAYIFKRDGTAWTEQAKITASDAAVLDNFGASVAISGDYAIVGAYHDDDAGTYAGSVYIFKRDEAAWTEQAKITASDAAAWDRFGYRVAISGDYAIVGAYEDDLGGESDSAYIFKRDEAAWTEQAKITASDATENNLFGASVAISGDYAIVGAYHDDGTGTASGSAYIFKRDGIAWTEQAKITASDAAENDIFGYSVAISGDYAVVGAHGDDDTGTASGSAYIYDISPGVFSCDSEGNPWDQFAPGETVYATGNILPAGTNYTLWIQPDAVSEGDTLNTSEDPSGAQESVNTNASGMLPVTAIWAIDPEAAITYTEYDIVADNQDEGVVGTYHASSDLLDSASTAGFVAPALDTTPPASITSLDSTTYGQTYINWTWTDPTDVDFSKVIVYLDGTYKEEVLKGVQCYNAIELTANTEYEIATRTVDNDGNINATWVNGTAMTATDTTPPASITSLDNATYEQTYINWTWTDPVDVDFSKVMVYLDGIYKEDVLKGVQCYNATGLTANTTHEIATRTVDNDGNINATWVNGTARTDVYAPEVKITASDGAEDDHFGASVAISGNYAVVGADGDDAASGSAYIFKRDATEWTEQAKITASDGMADDWFGYSVAISGDYAVVGAYLDDDAGTDSGSAYIFKRDATEWTEQAKITASDGAASDHFGRSVAISGDYVIVGAPYDDDAGTDSGSSYIFKCDGITWTEQAKITASDYAALDYFGYSVAISGDYVIVGSHGDNAAGTDSGSSCIFKRDGTEWTEQAKITASDGAEYDFFGESVAISGDYAVVGAGGDDAASGSAYIFKRDATEWTEQAKINTSDGAEGDEFGRSVAISGDCAVVGAYLDDDAGEASGSVHIFKRDGTAWTEQNKITASDDATYDWFGYSVAISGGYAVAGAWGDDDSGTDSGSAYIYDIPDTTAPPLNITSFAPPSPVADTEGAARTFSITVNQTANVSWLINGTEAQTNESVTSAAYTNASAAPGVWNVSAIASNANGTAMQTWWWTVLANTPPTASFTFSPSYPFVGHLVTFNGSDSSDPDGFITSYEWNFGDGNTSTGMVVTHSYSSAGTYAVTLEVTDNGERTGTKTIDVQYGEQPTRGDVNGNGYITSSDAAIALQIAVGSRPCDAATLDAADVSGDGSVTSLDALMILQAAVDNIEIG